CVLRRPPLGTIPPGANDMAREYRVLYGLQGCYPYAPKPFLFCPDVTVLGAPFLIMEYRPGLIVHGTLPDGLGGAEVGTTLSVALVELLSQLHAIEPASVGLGDLGKPTGFVQRTIENWARRASLATDNEPRPVVVELAQWLRAHTVPDAA